MRGQAWSVATLTRESLSLAVCSKIPTELAHLVFNEGPRGPGVQRDEKQKNIKDSRKQRSKNRRKKKKRARGDRNASL